MTVMDHAQPGRCFGGVMVLALILACIAGVAAAWDLPPSPRAYLLRMDTDHDGRVARAKYVAWMVRTFGAGSGWPVRRCPRVSSLMPSGKR